MVTTDARFELVPDSVSNVSLGFQFPARRTNARIVQAIERTPGNSSRPSTYTPEQQPLRERDYKSMSDITLQETQDPFTVTLVQKWMDQKDLVVTLDEKMALESFGRTKLLNGRFDAVNPEMTDKKPTNEVATLVRSFLSAEGLSDEDFVGFYETVRRTLKEFDSRLDKFVDANVQKVDESDKPKPEELEVMRKERKGYVDAMNGIRTLLEGTAPDWFKVEGSKLLVNADGKEDKWENLRGAIGDRGKTGKRLGTYQFTVTDPNGTVTPLTERKLGAIPAYPPLKKHVKNVADVWKAIMASNPNFDRDNQPDRFEFKIGDFNIVADKMFDDSSEDDSDDESAENTGDINELTLDIEDDDPADFESDNDSAETEKELFDDDPI